MGIFDLFGAEKTIGYVFKDKNLLRTCFTHASFSNENRACESNERLEFLGDSVLGYIVADYLYKRDIKRNEGVLTSEKQKYVSGKSLGLTAKKMKLNDYLLICAGNEKDKDNDSICENLFEAVVAGIYLDGGIECAKKFIYDNLLCDKTKEKTVDYKSELQVLTQKLKRGLPSYELIEKKGPDHNPKFKIAVYLGDKKLAESTAGKKSVAEQECAKKALKKLKGGKTNGTYKN